MDQAIELRKSGNKKVKGGGYRIRGLSQTPAWAPSSALASRAGYALEMLRV